MSFKLESLDYEYDALEPYIDAKTLEIHYTKHYAGYLAKFNDIIEGTELENKTISEILSNVSKYPVAVRNNGGGFYNHTLFWKMLTSHSLNITNIDLADAIVKYFGTLENLKDEFSGVAASQFGSGWAWLIKKANSELVVTSSPNQDNPLMDIAPIKGTPILCLDIWEHAYYLKYQNNRPEYIRAFWNVVNWEEVSLIFNSI